MIYLFPLDLKLCVFLYTLCCYINLKDRDVLIIFKLIVRCKLFLFLLLTYILHGLDFLKNSIVQQFTKIIRTYDLFYFLLDLGSYKMIYWLII
jgi:hypothetical protein